MASKTTMQPGDYIVTAFSYASQYDRQASFSTRSEAEKYALKVKRENGDKLNVSVDKIMPDWAWSPVSDLTDARLAQMAVTEK